VVRDDGTGGPQADSWISPSVRSEFPELSEEPLKIVVQFSTTCLCEKGFSSLF
jgi:hypothetical protein